MDMNALGLKHRGDRSANHATRESFLKTRGHPTNCRIAADPTRLFRLETFPNIMAELVRRRASVFCVNDMIGWRVREAYGCPRRLLGHFQTSWETRCS
jgi:hypothetical protein